MLRSFLPPSSHLDAFDLSHTERLALWSLRQLIGQHPPRCASGAARVIWGFGDDVVQLDAAFRLAVDELRQEGVQRPHIDMCASLAATRDERLLLGCLARMQQDDHDAMHSLASIFPKGSTQDLFMMAMKELAAALATCGYWLDDCGSGLPRSATPIVSDSRPSSLQPAFA